MPPLPDQSLPPSRRAGAPATLVLLLTLAVAFLAETLASSHSGRWWVYARFALTRHGLEEGHVYSLVTYAWLHALQWPVPVHLVLNLLVLDALGPLVERRTGWFVFLLIFLGGVVAGGLGFLAWSPEPTRALVGASAGIYALLGAAGMLHPHLRLFRFFGRGVVLWKLVIIALLLELLFLLMGWFPGISTESHLAGGLFGLAAGAVARRV